MFQQKSSKNIFSLNIFLFLQKQPPEVFYKKFVNFTGKYLFWSLFFNKVAGLTPMQVFSYKIPETFKNTLFEERL